MFAAAPFIVSSKHSAFYFAKQTFLSACKVLFHFPTETRTFCLASVEINTSIDRADLADDLSDLLQNLHYFSSPFPLGMAILCHPFMKKMETNYEHFMKLQLPFFFFIFHCSPVTKGFFSPRNFLYTWTSTWAFHFSAAGSLSVKKFDMKRNLSFFRGETLMRGSFSLKKAENCTKPLSQSLSALPAPLIGEPLACRFWSYWMNYVSQNLKRKCSAA